MCLLRSRLAPAVAAIAGVLAVALPAAPAGAAPAPVALAVGLDAGLPIAAVEALVDAVGGRLAGVLEPLDSVVVEAPAHRTGAVAAALQRNPGVAWVEPDPTFRVALQPNDTYWGRQWGASRIRAPAAWSLTAGAPDVVVAVLDTGVDPSHPDLQGALTAGRNFVRGGTDVSDDHGHGTAVAGVVGARTDNGRGIAGVCGGCRIMPVKVLDHEGVGTGSAIAQGITWAADGGADVINLSISGTSVSGLVRDAVAYARGKGAVVVAAAGNEGLTAATVPASYEGVISVAASDPNDRRYSFSNHGTWVDVAAPGCTVSLWPGGRYVDDFCGTSTSAPFVAGIAGLLRSRHPSLPVTAVEQAITSTAVPVGSWVRHGRVDAAGALLSLPAPADVTRVAGSDRVGTAVAVSREARTSAPAVVIARADGYADALAAAPLAAAVDGPILLTTSSTLPAAVATEIRRLGARTAHVVGGAAAVSPQVEADLRAAGVTAVERIAGADRFDTAARIARRVGGDRVYVTEGVNADPSRGWPDAVAVSALAAHERRPVLLVSRHGLPLATSRALVDLGVRQVTIVGGTAAVSATVETGIRTLAGLGGLSVDRVAGTDRWDTARRLADRAVAAGAGPSRTWLATGLHWPDALAAGPSVAASGGVLLLVDGRDLDWSPRTSGFLDAHRSAIDRVALIGGTAVLTDRVEQQAAARLHP